MRKPKKLILTGIICVLLIGTAAFGANEYFMIKPAFRDAVAIVEQDQQDTKEIAFVQQEPKPYMTMLPEESMTTSAPMFNFDIKGTSAQTVAAIPTAIYKQEKINPAVNNVLLLMDSNFFLISCNQKEQQAILFTLDPAVLLPVQGYGWTTLGNSYAMGGLPCVVNTLNQAFKLDINQYVFVNMESIWSVSDRMGGLPLVLSKAEAAELNRLMGTAYTAGENVMWTGGLQVYTKLTVDGDAIAHWQKACSAIFDKAKAENEMRQLKKAVFSSISTNLSVGELKDVGTILGGQTIKQYPFPKESETKLLNGDVVLDIDLDSSGQYMRQLIY